MSFSHCINFFFFSCRCVKKKNERKKKKKKKEIRKGRFNVWSVASKYWFTTLLLPSHAIWNLIRLTSEVVIHSLSHSSALLETTGSMEDIHAYFLGNLIKANKYLRCLVNTQCIFNKMKHPIHWQPYIQKHKSCKTLYIDHTIPNLLFLIQIQDANKCCFHYDNTYKIH